MKSDRRKRGYQISLANVMATMMVEEYQQKYHLIFGDIMELDKLLKEKIFSDLFKNIDIELSNFKAQQESSSKLGYIFFVTREEMVENEGFINLLQFLFEYECKDSCLNYLVEKFQIFS